MSSDSNILQNIPKGKPVRIFLPLLNRPDRVRAQSLYQETEPPKFSLIFKPGLLPVDELDLKMPCIISIDMGGPTISLEAMIQKVANHQTLQMIVRKSISHEQMREFFRVDTVTSVISKSFHTELFSNKNEPWSTKGQTVDISGSGILAIFDEKPQADRQVKLEITVPSIEKDKIKVLAHQVRVHELHDGRFEVAYHFDDITTEDRDKIIGSCLVVQRKMLRLKVKVNDN
ncbi:MAG: PilZ domain-containing protein [Desulfobulbaceae bacterium]|nr:PilZ domain-containing protein [Desulfobulbaceae bacterium]